MQLAIAIEVFVQAIAIGKSFTHPYLAEKHGDLWVMRDAPGRKDPRKTEVVTAGIEPEEAVALIGGLDLGWHFVCHIHADSGAYEDIRSRYKALGYRSLSTEWMFAHDLQHIPEETSNPPAREVTSQDEMMNIPQRASQPRKFRGHSRVFGVWDQTRDYGWVESVPVGENAWVSGLYVFADVRGRGYGRALMSAMLQSDRVRDVRSSVLLASSAGARLYPHLGYQQIGILQMFCPRHR